MSNPNPIELEYNNIRDLEIMRMFCSGYNRIDIAEELGLTYQIVGAIINNRLKNINRSK